MKILRIPFVIVLVAVGGRVTAQTFTNLHTFAATDINGNNSDGIGPGGFFVLSGSTLYGAATSGGTNGNGTIFSAKTNGTGFTTLYTFTTTDPNGNNSDGVGPDVSILSGNTLYGRALSGGTNGNGTIFSVKTNGTGFTTLHTFVATDPNGNNSDGVGPDRELILSGNTLYGSAGSGGTNGAGTIFAVKTNGTGFVTLHNFTATDPNGTNADGVFPNPLILSGTILYGTTQFGGRSGAGTLFSINTNGMSFTSPFSFPQDYDDALPEGPLILSGNMLYGTFDGGGGSGNGSLFAININGTGFTNLYSFTATDINGNNSDGVVPAVSVLVSNILYGIAVQGGTNGNGTVFAISTNGTGITTLYAFMATDANGNNSDGANPVEGLVLSGRTLYGPASAGGTNGNGTVFSLTLAAVSQPPFPTNQITKIQLSGTNVIFTIPSVAGETYQLQFSSSLTPTNWSNVAGASVTNGIGGILTLTNFGGAVGRQGFYRFDITP
jgi:uncharacterized repeat protein (TIGR03803 family)